MNWTDILLQSGGSGSVDPVLFGGIVLVVLFVLFFIIPGAFSSSQSIRRDDLSNLDGWDNTEDVLLPKKNIKELVEAIEDREQKLTRIVKSNAIQYQNPETDERVAQVDIDPNYRVELKVRTAENRIATITDEKIHKNTNKDDVGFVIDLINNRMDILPEKQQEASE